ncbi:phospholipase D family protein [Pedobacter nototheniae]|uniref:phospholipase D family protein n=1 Tax=Pedobacter nototheniae TaxID=2488994 RepID=UPI00103AE122|nr:MULTISPECIES: phospholipase D family protein [Pedobacter]
MTKFVKGSELNAALEKIINKAQSILLLISPFIKLHSRIRDELKLKKKSPDLKISIVYGKSENGNRLNKEDLAFLKEFPNIEIRYEKNLHAKYYGNEMSGLITSMNLYDFSQNNNIEAGILTETSAWRIGGISNFVGTGDLDLDAYNYFNDVISNSELLYQKVPRYESTMFNLSQKFIESVVEKDIIDHYHDSQGDTSINFKSYEKSDSKKEINRNKITTGFCIRTGAEIQFNIKKPYCEKAYVNWSKWANEEYPEKYCHFSGELSNGNTCYITPIMKKHWRDAKRTHNL